MAHGRANRQVVHRAHDPAAVAVGSAHAAAVADIVAADSGMVAAVARAGRAHLSSVNRKCQR